MVTPWCKPGDRTRLIGNSTPRIPSSLDSNPSPLLTAIMPADIATDSHSLAAIILAGGKSSRMGTDKAMLPFDNKTLLERLVTVVKPLTTNIVVMLSREQKLPERFYNDFPMVVIGRDSIAEQGPLQGIADAVSLLAQPVASVIVLSCDLPFISTEWLKKMLQTLNKTKDIDIICSKLGRHLNPLIAVYRLPILLEAKHKLKRGKRSCLALLDDCRVETMAPAGSESELISNINTPQEYKLALQKYNTSP